jgi:hypothetical protein
VREIVEACRALEDHQFAGRLPAMRFLKVYAPSQRIPTLYSIV